MCQTASAFSCGGAWCFTKRHYPLHRRRHHYCHSDDWQEAAHRTAQQNCDSARYPCGLLCPYRVMPRGFYTESSKCSDISSRIASNTQSNSWQTGGHCCFSIAILAPISDLSEPERCRSHGDLGTIHEILS